MANPFMHPQRKRKLGMMSGDAAAPSAPPAATARNFKARTTLAQTLGSCLTFAFVTGVRRLDVPKQGFGANARPQPQQRHLVPVTTTLGVGAGAGAGAGAARHMCHNYVVYAAMAKLGNALPDARTGDVCCHRHTRLSQAFCVVGPAMLLDTNQQREGRRGDDADDAIPAVGDVVFGMAEGNTARFRARCPFRMRWWSGNGRPLWTFVNAVCGPVREKASTLRHNMASHAGARDALFALFKLVVMGDVRRFVQQHLQGARMPPKRVLNLGTGVAGPLEWAWHVADAAEDDELKAAVEDAAPPEWSPPQPLSLRPQGAHAAPGLRAGRKAEDLYDEYGEVVVGVLQPDEWAPAFLRTWNARKEAAAAAQAPAHPAAPLSPSNNSVNSEPYVPSSPPLPTPGAGERGGEKGGGAGNTDEFGFPLASYDDI